MDIPIKLNDKNEFSVTLPYNKSCSKYISFDIGLKYNENKKEEAEKIIECLKNNSMSFIDFHIERKTVELDDEAKKEKKKKQIRDYLRNRYNTDPEFREKKKKECREKYVKKKQKINNE